VENVADCFRLWFI